MGKKMKIVRINGFQIPGLEYPSKPLKDLPALRMSDSTWGLEKASGSR